MRSHRARQFRQRHTGEAISSMTGKKIDLQLLQRFVFSCCKPESVSVAGARWRGQQEPDWLSVHFSAPFDFLVVQRGKPMPAQHSATHFGTIRAVQCVRFSRFRNAAERIPTGRLECTSAMGPSCGAYWTSVSSTSTSVWPSGQSGFSFWWSRGKINHHLHSS